MWIVNSYELIIIPVEVSSQQIWLIISKYGSSPSVHLLNKDEMMKLMETLSSSKQR